MRPFARACLIAALLTAGCGDSGARASADEIENGRALYAANGCGTCHGLSGRGDGPVGKTLQPPPRDFRDAAAFKNGIDPSSVANTIATGLTRDGGQMQSYFHLSSRERHLLARYVISLRESTEDASRGDDVFVDAPPAVRVTGAWVREPVPGRSMAAAYAVVENAGPADVQIVAASADAAGTVEMHETTRSGDMMKMSPVKSITIPAHGRVALEPGGLHLMLFDLGKPLKDGDTVTLTFTTGSAARVSAAAAVKKPEMSQ
jgi:copper(I)-binding protein/mono/diheme cytochrome c family protein